MTGESSLPWAARAKIWSDCDGLVEILGMVDELERIRQGQVFNSLVSCEVPALTRCLCEIEVRTL
jgi:hypothetical protein